MGNDNEIAMQNLDLTNFRRQGMGWSVISRATGILRKAIASYIRGHPDFEDPFAKIVDPEAVKNLILPIMTQQRNCGEANLRGYLKSEGYVVPRRILRLAMEVADPGGRERRPK